MILIMVLLLFALLLASVSVAGTMASMGLLLNVLFSERPLYRALGEVTWGVWSDFNLFAIPLFVLLGQLLVVSGVAEKTYRVMEKWMSWLPGGLMHANIAASAVFSATSGSSVATAATMGTLALPEAKRFGYHDGLFSASIAAGGTLGILIPPSINMIVYGFLTDTSIPRLFLAGIVPGLLLSALFMATIAICCTLNPRLGAAEKQQRYTWGERVRSLTDLTPILLIFIVVLGTIYAGIATPTESAALGLVVAVLIAARERRLTLKTLVEAGEGTFRTTGMIMLILAGAYFLNFIFINLGLVKHLAAFLQWSGLSAYETLFLIIAMYIILGFFIETLSMMVLTIPVVFPIIRHLGFDPVWFGIVMIILVEMALITPPVGLNLYVVQGVRGRGSISDILLWIIPFALAMLLLVGMLILWPELALFLGGTA